MEKGDLIELLKNMTLEEKIGQMIQLSSQVYMNDSEAGTITGPTDTLELKDGARELIGSILGISGAERLRQMQSDFIENHPHHIPLLFMADVINGFQTVFPIPLAQGCTFSPEVVETVAAISAKEAAVSGLHVTFSPMLDLVRDARWGRVMESTGEDPYLNSILGDAAVRGYQGNDLKEYGKIAACLKHFAGYGHPEGGRDYDNVELSERTLYEDYLPAYGAAVKAGCRMAMTSFNTLNRVPSSGNRWLLREILRKKMEFDGVLISDYGAVEEMISHGYAEDTAHAAQLALEAGVDIDMMSNAYLGKLAALVRDGALPESLVDEAVMRVLSLKNDLGLFENPYKDGNEQCERMTLLCEDHRRTARKIAASTFVLLKNEGILPLVKESDEKIVWIGPYVDNAHIFGSWSYPSTLEGIVTIHQGAIEKKNSATMHFVKGCPMLDRGMKCRTGESENYSQDLLEMMYQEAVDQATSADKVILCIGEHSGQSGEAGSRIQLTIPDVQMELLRRVYQVNSNIVTVLFSGRPLVLTEVERYSKAILVVWMPGTEGGNAIADVLFGDKMPQGKLSMSFPRSTGQVPIYYNHFMTGRPNKATGNSLFCNGYIDESCWPLYPFGFGLSYTDFSYSDIELSSNILSDKSTIMATVIVTNVGCREGTETVQMYLRDISGSVVRPVKMLKGFQKVSLKSGESRPIKFSIDEKMLRFYDINMNYVSEPGKFQVFIGGDSQSTKMSEFTLI